MKKLLLTILCFLASVVSAADITQQYASGSALYSRVRNSTGQVADINAVTFVTWADANDPNYAISLTDMGGGLYLGDISDWIKGTDGTFDIQTCLQATGTPLSTDTIVGTGRVTYQSGNYYLQFNGSNGYIAVPNNSAFDISTEDFSFLFWIKMSNSASLTQIIIQNLKSSGGFWVGYEVRQEGYIPHLSTFIFPGGISVNTGGTSSIYDNKWHHIAITFDRDGNGSTYFDGVLDANSITDMNSTNVDISTGNSLIIGAEYDLDNLVYQNYFSGVLDDLRIYKAILTSDEITTIYNSGFGCRYDANQTPTSGAASFALNMDEGSGDKTLNAIDGTLQGTLIGGVTWQSGGVGTFTLPVIQKMDKVKAGRTITK